MANRWTAHHPAWFVPTGRKRNHGAVTVGDGRSAGMPGPDGKRT
jgi:hypothetical protein